ncbi:MAG: S-layer homology domain-containing protein [Acidimicrobiia bacterium]
MRTRLALAIGLIAASVTLVAGPAAAVTATITAPATADVGQTVGATITLTDVPIIAIVSVDWGDGSAQDTLFLSAGAHQATHVYNEPGTFGITANTADGPAITLIEILPFDGTFADDDGSVFLNDIEWLAGEGITKGCNPPYNTLFCPNQVVTRGQMAAFLSRALGYTAAPDAGFTDTAGSTFETDINKLATAGVTKGCNPPANDKYCPNDPVTRGQMAAFLVRAFSYTAVDGGVNFTDIGGNVFETNIVKLATAGVTKGCNPPANDKYCPNSAVTRGQMAAFLHRALGG